MSARTAHPLVVIGSGPGIGMYVAKLFAARRYDKVALVARRQESLDRDRQAVIAAAAGVEVQTFVADASDTASLGGVLGEVRARLGVPETVFFNAAQVRESFPPESAESAEEDLELNFKARTTRPFHAYGAFHTHTVYI